MLNLVVLIGRLTHDPELRYTPGNGTAVTTFDLAVDRPFANKQGEREADFIRIVAWDKLAETCANYLQKGRLIAATGRLQIRSYDDREGVRRKAAEVVARDVRFLEPPRTKDSGDGADSFSGDEVSEDDIPF